MVVAIAVVAPVVVVAVGVVVVVAVGSVVLVGCRGGVDVVVGSPAGGWVV